MTNPTPGDRRPRPGALVAPVALSVALALTAPGAGAQPAIAEPSPQLAELNAQWADISDTDRSDLVLAPALLAMDEPPAAASTVIDAARLIPGAPDWPLALAWAGGSAQLDAIAALKTITERRSRFVFAQPYGKAAGTEAINTGLYVDLGDPELIANARSGWLDPLERLGALVQIEATRLASEDAGADAMDLVVRWIRFARSFADRELFTEKMRAFHWMRFGAERLRDLAYLYPKSVDDLEIRAAIRSLADRELNLDRILLPRAEHLAADELLARTFIERDGPNPETFGPTFARMGAGGRPLRLFAEAARWRAIADQHADYFATRDRIEAIYKDWRLRWSVDPRDIIMKSPTDYASLDRGRYMLIATVVPDLGALFTERTALRVELGGTRLALAIVGYRAWSGVWPEPIYAVRPRFITKIPVDPWDPAETEPYHYFIPMRGGVQNERTTPKPHEMQILGPQAEGAVSTGPTPSEIVSWLARSGTQQPTDPQTLRQLLQIMPEKVPAQMRNQIRAQLLKKIQQQGGTKEADVPDWVRTLAGAGPNDTRSLEEIRVDAGMRITFSPAYRRALESLSKQTSFTLDDVRQAIAKVIIGMLSTASAPAGGGGQPLYAVPTFSRSFDDSVFILYSVGPDEKPDQAERVGPGGNDLLIWPPLFSLVREELGG